MFSGCLHFPVFVAEYFFFLKMCIFCCIFLFSIMLCFGHRHAFAFVKCYYVFLGFFLCVLNVVVFFSVVSVSFFVVLLISQLLSLFVYFPSVVEFCISRPTH